MAFEEGKLRGIGTNFRETNSSIYAYNSGDTTAVISADNYFPKLLFDGAGGFVHFVASDKRGILFVEIKAGVVKSKELSSVAKA